LFCLATENRTQDTGHVSISGPQPICAKSRALSAKTGIGAKINPQVDNTAIALAEIFCRK
ncbi:MAG: hypothetical protein E6Z09_06535, partial [Bifidobacterium longum]|nr:hypothetical protein [Bifidobacterium longum]